jgi:transcriptional regulator with XRE-family HTH domain
MDISNLGKNVKKFRSICGFTQKELADKVGISTLYINKIENKTINVSSGIMIKLALALNIKHVGYLFYDDDDMIIDQQCTIREVLLLLENNRISKMRACCMLNISLESLYEFNRGIKSYEETFEGL